MFNKLVEYFIDTGSKSDVDCVVASKKVSRELGDPFGFLNEFGGIGGGVSNIIPTLLSQGFGKKFPTSIRRRRL